MIRYFGHYFLQKRCVFPEIGTKPYEFQASTAMAYSLRMSQNDDYLLKLLQTLTTIDQLRSK